METFDQLSKTPAVRGVSPQELRVVGGNAALDLCNSRSGPHQGGIDIDGLTRIDDLVPWAVHTGVLTAEEGSALVATDDPGASGPDTDRRPASSALADLLALRERAHAVFHAVASGAEPSVAALHDLRLAEREAQDRAQYLREGDGYGYTWPATDKTVIVDRVAHAASVLLGDGPLSRVKQCAGCSFLFLDESKNGSRRWCSMDDCGREAKKRLYVERRRSRAHAGSATEL
jgi:predicted RNA-binding Zn ribbon-like protein